MQNKFEDYKEKTKLISELKYYNIFIYYMLSVTNSYLDTKYKTQFIRW